MPWLRGNSVLVQHDGAKPHNGGGNLVTVALNAAYAEGGWNIEFITQPAQSPDLNILDLGLFASLKSRVYQLKMNAVNMQQLMAKVMVAYNEYDVDTINHIGIFSFYNRILKNDGGNMFQLPHSGINRRQKNGLNPIDLKIDVDAYNRVFNLING